LINKTQKIYNGIEGGDMIKYLQFVPSTASGLVFLETIEHVKQHISSIADPEDDPNTHADQVEIKLEPTIRESDGAIGTTIYGSLDADPIAPYLHADFDPEEDVRTNPLTVPSILDERSEDERSES